MIKRLLCGMAAQQALYHAAAWLFNSSQAAAQLDLN
jgi:hypothetical protein